ncbi:MAG: MCE family protein [Candidatus Omnitrophica bacterium]|nr:MCE family protein [Candidatus Omnitrophota bacterium]MBI5143444.1 MCE family protein [Candidatus Omnitrophota bacterium]
MKMTNELKTGMVVVAAIVVAVIFWVKTTDFSARPYKLKTYFNYAEGVKVDSIVKLSGIEVGRVEKIKFNYEPETRVELILTLNKKAKLREDSIAFISTSGLIGDAYIGITAGSPDKPFVKEGATLISEDPVEMRKLMKKAEGIAENLDKTLVEVKGLAQNLTGVVKDNRQRVDNIAVNLEQTAVNFKEFSEDIKKHPWKLLMKGKEK